MKVALLSDCYPPRVGGIESQVSDLAHQLAAAGHEVQVHTATAGVTGASRGEVEREGEVLVHRHSHPATFGVPVNPLAAPTLRRRLQAAAVDVAHVHMGVVSPFAWDATRVATGLGVPTVVTWHCLLDRAATPWRLSGAPQRWVERGARLSAVSRLAADGVRQAAPGHEVAVLPNGIDVAAWAPSAATGSGAGAAGHGGSGHGGAGRGGDGPVRVVSALRLAPRKRPGVLLDVVAEVRRRTGAEISLDVLGDGPLRAQLQRRAQPGDRLLGRVPRASLPERYRSADVYLAPTRLEAFGIAALEARTAGLPVVARRDSGTRDVIDDGVSGLLADDDAGLIEALERLVTDPLLRSRLAAHNASTPPPQAWPSVVRDVEAAYAEAVVMR
ncbi:hypothetical protein GCM10027055_18000 [Janibacter alkaliphilus]|uniref:D-inositol 3-phosphate glycosyltransferase n=1 Tax=Janibacter alkaliphilus TaxID=1069963 RepID=A0A852X388_9MICO|nr:glycosyltransferase involved in cell wall biosynthesis [Janibacter alkaliphilus]